MKKLTIPITLQETFESKISWHLRITEFVARLLKNPLTPGLLWINEIEEKLEDATLEKKKRIVIEEKIAHEKSAHNIKQAIVFEESWRYIYPLTKKVFQIYITEEQPKLSFFKQDLWNAIVYKAQHLIPSPFEIYNPDPSSDEMFIYNVLQHVFYYPIKTVDVLKYLDKKLIEFELIDEYLEKVPRISKIPWNGTPAEFGTIMSELIDKGFLTLNDNLLATVGMLSQFFDVRGENGKDVTAKHLYQCFREKKKHYRPNEFRIPQSKNYMDI